MRKQLQKEMFQRWIRIQRHHDASFGSFDRWFGNLEQFYLINLINFEWEEELSHSLWQQK